MQITHTTPRRRGVLKAMAAGAATLSLPALAAWPDKPIKIVVTFPPGGASDIVARVMGEQLAHKLGQAVVVDNRPGAGGSVGGSLVAQAPADGCTLMLSNSTHVVTRLNTACNEIWPSRTSARIWTSSLLRFRPAPLRRSRSS